MLLALNLLEVNNMYWILTKLQEMANEHDQEIVITDVLVTYIIPQLTYLINGVF